MSIDVLDIVGIVLGVCLVAFVVFQLTMRDVGGRVPPPTQAPPQKPSYKKETENKEQTKCKQ